MLYQQDSTTINHLIILLLIRTILMQIDKKAWKVEVKSCSVSIFIVCLSSQAEDLITALKLRVCDLINITEFVVLGAGAVGCGSDRGWEQGHTSPFAELLCFQADLSTVQQKSQCYDDTLGSQHVVVLRNMTNYNTAQVSR
jgi:hypothetical protein